MTQHLTMTPTDMHSELAAAACRYAAMSPSDFEGDTLFVSSTKLRDLGMIASETWARVPAGGAVRVRRTVDGKLQARVTLPWQAATDDPGLALHCARPADRTI